MSFKRVISTIIVVMTVLTAVLIGTVSASAVPQTADIVPRANSFSTGWYDVTNKDGAKIRKEPKESTNNVLFTAKYENHIEIGKVVDGTAVSSNKWGRLKKKYKYRHSNGKTYEDYVYVFLGNANELGKVKKHTSSSAKNLHKYDTNENNKDTYNRCKYCKANGITKWWPWKTTTYNNPVYYDILVNSGAYIREKPYKNGKEVRECKKNEVLKIVAEVINQDGNGNRWYKLGDKQYISADSKELIAHTKNSASATHSWNKNKSDHKCKYCGKWYYGKTADNTTRYFNLKTTEVKVAPFKEAAKVSGRTYKVGDLIKTIRKVDNGVFDIRTHYWYRLEEGGYIFMDDIEAHNKNSKQHKWDDQGVCSICKKAWTTSKCTIEKNLDLYFDLKDNAIAHVGPFTVADKCSIVRVSKSVKLNTSIAYPVVHATEKYTHPDGNVWYKIGNKCYICYLNNGGKNNAGNITPHSKHVWVGGKQTSCTTEVFSCAICSKKDTRQLSTPNHKYTKSKYVCDYCQYYDKNKLIITNIPSTRMVVLSDSAVTHVGPYKACSTNGTLKTGDFVYANQKIKNAAGNDWYHLTNGKYIFGDYVIKHTDADHEWGNGVITREPNGNIKGEKTFYCKYCSKTRTEEFAYTIKYQSGKVYTTSSGNFTLSFVLNSNNQIRITRINDSKALNATQLVLPDTIKGYVVYDVSKNAFSGCNHVKSVVFPDSMTSIDLSVFGKKSKTMDTEANMISSITLGSKIKDIRSIDSCPANLTAIRISENNPYYMNGTSGEILSKDGKTLILLPPGNKTASYTMPSSVTSIGSYAFSHNCNLSNIGFSKNLENIGFAAFSSCEKLGAVDLPESLRQIGAHAFDNCANLTQVTIPNGKLEKIDNCAFRNCGTNLYDNFLGILGEKREYSSAFTIEHMTVEFGSKAIDNAAQINGYKNSSAQTYAQKNNISFCAFGSAKETERDAAKIGFVLDNVLSNVSLSNGKLKGPEIKYSVNGEEKKFPLFEFDAGVDLPILKNASFQIDKDTRTVHILVGIMNQKGSAKMGAQDANDTYWKQSYKDVKKFLGNFTNERTNTTGVYNWFRKNRKMLKKINGKIAMDCDMQLAGYIDIPYNDNGLLMAKAEGGIIAEVSVGATLTARPIAAFPVAYVEFGVKGSLNGNLKLSYDEKLNNLINEGTISGTLETHVALGVGEKTVATFIEGRLTADLTSTLNYNSSKPKDKQTDLSVTMKYKLSLEGQVLGHKLPFENIKYERGAQIYPDFKELNLSKKTNASPSAAYQVRAAAKVMAPHSPLLARNYKMTTQISTGVDRSVFKKDDLYPYSMPSLTALSDGKLLLIWVDDDGSKDDVNRTNIFYSVYDGSSWSSPQVLDNGEGYMESPVTAADANGHAYVVYRKSSGASSTDDFDCMKQSIDLYMKEFDGSTFGEAYAITSNNNAFEFAQRVVPTSEGIIISWIENSEDDLFMVSGNNTVHYLGIQNGQQLGQATVFETDSAILSMTSGADTNYDIYLTLEAEPQTIFRIRDGISETVYTGSADVSNLTLVGGELYFLCGGNLTHLNTASMESELLSDVMISSFNANLGKDGEIIFTTYTQAENGTDIFSAVLQSGTMSAFLPIGHDDGFIRDLTDAVTSDGHYIAIINSVEIKDEMFGKSTLYSMTSNNEEQSDVILNDVIPDLSSIEEGYITVTLNVSNTSQQELTDIRISASDGTKELAFTPENPLASGETNDIEIEIPIDETFKTTDYTFTVFGGRTKTNNKVNTQKARLGGSALRIDQVSYETNAAVRTATGEVVNLGFDDAENVVVYLKANGIEIAQYTIGLVKAKASSPVSIAIPAEYCNTDGGREVVYELYAYADGEAENGAYNEVIATQSKTVQAQPYPYLMPFLENEIFTLDPSTTAIVGIQMYNTDWKEKFSCSTNFAFDSNRLEIIEVKNGELYENMKEVNGNYEFTGIKPATEKKDAVLCYVTLKPVNTGRTEDLFFGADFVSVKENTNDGDVEWIETFKELVPVAPQINVAFSISTQPDPPVDHEILYGDVNGDGDRDSWDIVLMRRYLAKWSDVNINIAAADTSGDGEFDSWDIVLMRRYLAKWDVTLGPKT